ncbi:unnamed protein product [Ectocarpus sp. 4 AP-2014]
MPAEAEHTAGDARKRAVAVAEFAEFVHALEEFHSKADHDVLDALRVANNGRVGRVFSEADAHVLEIGGASGAEAPAIPVADSPPPSPLVGAAASPAPPKVEEAQLPPRSSRRGKLRVRDSNVSTASQQETAATAAAAADRGKRQRTAVGRKDSGGAAAVPPSAQDEAGADKENRPAAAVAKGRGRPPLPKRKKLGGGTANPTDADGSGSKAEPVRRSGRNSGLPPEPTEGSRARGGSIVRAPHSSGGGGGCTQNSETGDNGDTSSTGDVAAAEIAELRAIKVSSMKVVDLRAALRKLGASAGGLKAVLQVRLEETIAARISELETPSPTMPTTEGLQEEGEQEEQRDAPAAGAAASSEDASSDSRLPSTRSSVAPGAALGPLTRLSMPRLSAESAAVPSPVRASPFFGDDSEQQRQQQQQQQEASAAVAVAAAAAAVGVEGALEGASGAPESVGGGDGDDCVEDLMDIDSEKLESDDDSGDDIEEMETDTSKTDQLGVQVGEAAAAGSAREEEVPETGTSGDMEESEGEGGADLPLSPVPGVASGVPAAADADSDTVPVAEEVTELVQEVATVDVSGNMVEDEDEEGAEEGEVVQTEEDRKGLADEAAPEESGSPSGTAGEGGAKVEGEAAGAGDVSAKGMAVEEERPNGEAAIEDKMEVEEPRSEGATPKDIFVPPALEDKSVGHGSVSSSSGTQSFPCKTPGSAAVSRSSTSLLSSGGSSITNVPRNDSGVGPPGGSGGDVVGGKRARPIAAQETPGSTAGSAVPSSVGRSGGGGGGGKRPKTGKEKVSLQEIMSQMRKTYAKKGGTPGAASKAGNAGARKAAADFMATRKPEEVAAAAPAAPAPAAVPSTPALKPDARSEAAVAAAAEAPPAPAASGPTSAEPAEPSAAPVAVGKPSNLITTLHSFTSVLSKKNAAGAGAAPVGKWDRLAAGAGASSNARTVPALRKAEEARLLEERRARERAASRVRTQAGGGATVAAAAGKQQLQQPHAASASAARSQGERVTPSGAMARVGAAKACATQATAAGSKSAGVTEGKAVPSAGTGGAPSQPHLAPLRVTGMLSKLVPGGVAGPAGLGTEEIALPPSSRKVSDLSSSNLPEPFRRSEDLFVGGAAAAAAAAAAADCDNASVRSAGSTSSSCFSMGVSSTAGGRPSSTVSSSERVEKKIRDQRAKIALKRQVRLEKIKAEEARKKAELETKELRDAARLEASRRAKQETEARLREQKAQRQAEVEQRREQERADKEARDARERQEKEARRLAAVAEAKAKAAQEGAAIKAQQARKPEPAAVAAPAAAPAAALTIAGATAVEGKPVAVLKRVSPAAAPASSADPTSTAGRPAAAVAAAAPASSSGLKAAVTTAVAASASSSSHATAAGPEYSGAASAKGKAAAAGTAAAGTGVVESYEMSDHDGDTSESESDEEEMRERSRRSGKKIPAWAKGSALSEALTRQYATGQKVDPDKIFPEVFTCDLEAIFPVNKSRYHRRGSSANWAPDRVTPQEVLTYKRSVGIAKVQKH